MRRAWFGVLVLTTLLPMVLVGCSGDSSESSTSTPGSSGSSTTPPNPAEIKAENVDAVASAKEIGFPLIDHPSKPPIATMKKVGDNEKRYEFTQTTTDPIEPIKAMYVKKLDLQPSGNEGKIFMGQSASGLFVQMMFEKKGEETVIRAKVIVGMRK
ncbi:MAG: hypothetical protein JST35_02585 [Armatimonadetes bacterium]|nr:hypothetical protein [Armatimonadota bacterium]